MFHLTLNIVQFIFKYKYRYCQQYYVLDEVCVKQFPNEFKHLEIVMILQIIKSYYKNKSVIYWWHIKFRIVQGYPWYDSMIFLCFYYLLIVSMNWSPALQLQFPTIIFSNKSSINLINQNLGINLLLNFIIVPSWNFSSTTNFSPTPHLEYVQKDFMAFLEVQVFGPSTTQDQFACQLYP